MIRNHFIITLALVLTLAFAATASADVFTFNDTVKHWEGWGTQAQNDNDTIGVPDFRTGQVTYTGGDTMTGFSVDYKVKNNFGGFNALTSGDLFINTDDDTSWNYLVDLNGRTGGVANVYEFTASYTDQNAYTLSSGSGVRNNHPIAGIVQGLNPVAQVMWSGIEDASSGNKYGTVSVSGLDIEFDVLTVAYTVSCANDVVMAGGMSKTPIPAAAWLLGSGMAGLLGLRRRNRA